MTAARTSVKRSARNAQRPTQGTINAGIGGVGGGTGLVAIAQTIGSHTILGEILLYLAPAVSVIAGTIFYQLKIQADWYGERWQIRRARKTIERQLESPHTSEDHKIEIRKMLEELDHSVAISELNRVKLL
jgi:hypothetical protein